MCRLCGESFNVSAEEQRLLTLFCATKQREYQIRDVCKCCPSVEVSDTEEKQRGGSKLPRTATKQEARTIRVREYLLCVVHVV